MVIPNRDPGKVLVARNQIQVGSVSCEALSVIVKSASKRLDRPSRRSKTQDYIRVDIVSWQRNAVVRISPTVLAIRVFIDIITKVDDVVDRVLSHGVSIGIEEPKGFSQAMLA